MPPPAPVLFVDLVDPGSLVMLRRVGAVADELGTGLVVRGFEIRPPPEPLVDPRDPGWLAYWSEMAPLLRELGVSPSAPALVPWTRKAHELVLEAREAGSDADPVDDLLCLFVEEGADIGRVDVLLERARSWGMDPTRTKATLDVDRHAGALVAARARALDDGVRGVPTLAVGASRLEGILDEPAIRRMLGGA